MFCDCLAFLWLPDLMTLHFNSFPEAMFLHSPVLSVASRLSLSICWQCSWPQESSMLVTSQLSWLSPCYLLWLSRWYLLRQWLYQAMFLSLKWPGMAGMFLARPPCLRDSAWSRRMFLTILGMFLVLVSPLQMEPAYTWNIPLFPSSGTLPLNKGCYEPDFPKSFSLTGWLSRLSLPGWNCQSVLSMFLSFWNVLHWSLSMPVWHLSRYSFVT